MSSDSIVLIRLYDAQHQLQQVLPNLPANAEAIQKLNDVASETGLLDRAAVQAAQNHLPLIPENETWKIERVTSNFPNLLSTLTSSEANAAHSNAFIDLLNQGKVRAAEKVAGVWQPQTYVIDGILAYFRTHDNVRMGQHDWDKVELKTANYTDAQFQNEGVRYAPGSMVRTGAYIGPQTVIMNQAFVNIGAYIAGEGVMIDGGARVASCAQIGKGVKFGAGSGIEGILEPAGRMPSIVEDGVKIGAMCEVTGIIGEGSVIASGVIMASGKKIFDEDTNDFVAPLKCEVGTQTFLLPVIPPYRLAVGGSILNENGRTTTDAIILKKGDLRDSSTMKHFEKQGILYG